RRGGPARAATAAHRDSRSAPLRAPRGGDVLRRSRHLLPRPARPQRGDPAAQVRERPRHRRRGAGHREHLLHRPAARGRPALRPEGAGDASLRGARRVARRGAPAARRRRRLIMPPWIPSRAQPIAASISSTPVLTQLNDGTSRTVWVEASLSRISCTRSRKSLTESLSKATTNSWSSSPKEYAVLIFTDGYR